MFCQITKFIKYKELCKLPESVLPCWFLQSSPYSSVLFIMLANSTYITGQFVLFSFVHVTEYCTILFVYEKISISTYKGENSLNFAHLLTVKNCENWRVSFNENCNYFKHLNLWEKIHVLSSVRILLMRMTMQHNSLQDSVGLIKYHKHNWKYIL